MNAAAPKIRAVKCVDWSYPTSTNAERFKCKNGGCWTVNLTEFWVIDIHGRECAVTRAVSGGYATRSEAVSAAQLLIAPWASWSKEGGES